MPKQTKPDEYAYADAHGPSIIAARNAFLLEIHGSTPRASGVEVEGFLDYMIESRYFSNFFFAAWSFVGGGDDE